MATQLVKDWMTSNVITVSGKCTLSEAYWLMLEKKIRRLPVVDDDVLIGIVTLEDLRQAEPPTGIGLDLGRITDRLSKMTVNRIMTKELKTILATAPLIDAARLMLKHKIRVLPVLDEDKLIGIITESDIFRAFVELEGKS